MMLAEDAAIMDPDPTPAPIARASGSKIFQLATSEVSSVMNTAPKRVPKTYMASTPRYWSESGPYFSETMAKDGSRSRENVAPTVALPIRSRTARGRASAMVPSRWPTSCSSSAGPALIRLGRLGPMLNASLATRSSTATPTRAAAIRCRSRPRGLNFWMETNEPEDEAPDHGEDDDRADSEVDLGLADELDGDGNDEGQRGDRKREPGTGFVYPRVVVLVLMRCLPG